MMNLGGELGILTLNKQNGDFHLSGILQELQYQDCS